MWIGFKVFFHLNELPYKKYMVEKVKKMETVSFHSILVFTKLVDDDFQW